jgi:hypothetical protein
VWFAAPIRVVGREKGVSVELVRCGAERTTHSLVIRSYAPAPKAKPRIGEDGIKRISVVPMMYVIHNIQN